MVGMFLEGNAVMIVLAPLLAPVANQYGIDPVHFGIIFIFNSAIGTITPPLGTVMFTTCSITKVAIEDFVKEVLPFWLLLICALMIITFVPVISIGLPNFIFN